MFVEHSGYSWGGSPCLWGGSCWDRLPHCSGSSARDCWPSFDCRYCRPWCKPRLPPLQVPTHRTRVCGEVGFFHDHLALLHISPGEVREVRPGDQGPDHQASLLHQLDLEATPSLSNLRSSEARPWVQEPVYITIWVILIWYIMYDSIYYLCFLMISIQGKPSGN